MISCVPYLLSVACLSFVQNILFCLFEMDVTRQI